MTGDGGGRGRSNWIAAGAGLGAATAIAALSAMTPAAQSALPPGFVDPAPILAAASAEIGEANLRCVMFSGTG